MSKPVVFVIGATGNVGVATLKSLSSKYAGRVEIRAGVRNPEKAEQIQSLAGVTVVKAAMGGEGLEETLKGVHSLFIVTPGAENRAELVIATAGAAKRAGVKHQVIVSVLTADNTDTVFGRQCTKLETEVKALGVAYTFLRLPFFVENYWGFKDTIKGAGAIYTPVDPTKTFSPVVVGDVGNAAAAVLVEPAKHTNQTYNVISDRHTYNEVATAFSEALGKTVTYTRVSYDDAKKAFLGTGIPEWQVDGGIELFKLMNEEDPIISTENVGDYQKITGEQPTNLKAWVAQVKGAFE
jgi:uncharacterized protein YbjT (DUF2867 family)